MYALLGPDACLETLEIAAGSAGFRVDRSDPLGLKFAYNRWLAQSSGAEAATLCETPELVADPAGERALLSFFIEAAAENDCLDAITPEVVETTILRRDQAYNEARLVAVETARDELHALEPDWGMLFDLYVNRVFCADIPRNVGGSTGRAIGVMWANPPAWSRLPDLVEFCVHELTHHIVFVDDRVHGHYGPTGHVTFADSAIRGTRRPLPAVLDSLLVGVEILYFRTCVSPILYEPLLHPPTDFLIKGMAETIASIEAISDPGRAFAPRGWELFLRAKALAEELGVHPSGAARSATASDGISPFGRYLEI